MSKYNLVHKITDADMFPSPRKPTPYRLIGNGYCINCKKTCAEKYLIGKKTVVWVHAETCND